MSAPRPAEPYDAFRALAARRGRPAERLTESLAGARAETADGPEAWAPPVGIQVGLPAAAALGPASYFADFASPHGRRHVRVCTATACFAAEAGRHLADVEAALGVAAGDVTPDGERSLQAVRCLGYCYAGPAALDGDAPRTGPALATQLAGREHLRAPEIPAAPAVARLHLSRPPDRPALPRRVGARRARRRRRPLSGARRSGI
ncbi:NAD(P)H-dependent oxidoreductase subunit E [Streptomyces iranensis]|uniref:NADH-quinone oxidoreductase subunit NuoE family protein n=1 Tax=Streptomyces iranensis TaxID=576784 RepID=UPI0039B788CC